MVFQYAILNLRSELATTIHEASIFIPFYYRPPANQASLPAPQSETKFRCELWCQVVYLVFWLVVVPLNGFHAFSGV